MNRMRNAACALLLIATPLTSATNQNKLDNRSPAAQAPNQVSERRPLTPAQQRIVSVLDQVLEEQKSSTDESLRVAMPSEAARAYAQ